MKYITSDTELSSIANAIRRKGQTEALLEYPEGFIEAIDAISGGESVDLIEKTINENGIYEASIDDNADGYGQVTVNVNPGKIQLHYYDLTHGYVTGGKWVPEAVTVCSSDVYEVDAGKYFLSLDENVGTRFRAMFSTQDTSVATSTITGTQIINENDPQPRRYTIFDINDTGYITIQKDNANNHTLKSYLYKLYDLVDGTNHLPSGTKYISTLDEYDVSANLKAEVSLEEQAKIIPGNIKKDVTILGITGTYEETLPQLFAPVVTQTNNEATWNTNSSNGAFTVTTVATIDGANVASPLTITAELDGKQLVVTSSASNFTPASSSIQLVFNS